MNRMIWTDILSRMTLLIPIAIGFGYALILNKLPIDQDVNDNKEVVRGVLLTLLGHAVVFILFFSSSLGTEFFRRVPDALKGYAALIFLIQLVYVIPLIVAGAAKKRPGIIKGALITGTLTFILSVVSCFGLGALR